MLTLYLRKKPQEYGIAEMTIVFSIATVCAALMMVIVGGLLSLLEIPTQVLTIGGLIIFGIFIIWMWISFVIIGREWPEPRVSTGVLTAMQILCSCIIGWNWLFAPSEDKGSWMEVSDVFALIILSFHAVYFTLAWGMRTRIPLRIDLMFAVLVGLEWVANR